MALEKQSLNNFLPDGFETEDKDGYKTNFSDDKISTGFQKDVADILSGPNLNNLIDVIGKNTNTLNNYVEYLNSLSVNKTPIIDSNNQLNSTQIGLKVYSATETYLLNDLVTTIQDGKVLFYKSLVASNKGNPLTNTDYWEEVKLGGGSGLELCDIGMALYVDETKGLRRYLNGQIVDINTNTQAFLNRLQQITTLHPSLLCTENEWQTAKTLSAFGQVGKFVFNYSGDEIVSVRLPRVVNVQGLFDLQNLGMTVDESLPNISGTVYFAQGSIYNADNPNSALYGTNTNTLNQPASTTPGDKYEQLHLDASRSSSTSQNGAPVQQEAIQYPYFIQIATGQETEINIVNTLENVNGFTLLESKYSDKPLYNESWLLSNGQWNPKATYPTVYEALQVEYNSEIEAGTTVTLPSGVSYTKRGLSVKLSTETYTDYDFVLNTAEETFRLPLKTKQKFYDDTAPVVGNGMALGLTNFDKNVGLVSGNFGFSNSESAYGQLISSTTSSGTNYNGNFGVTTDSTKSGIETHLTETTLYLYFYVGDLDQNHGIVNMGRIGEQVATKTDMLQASGAGMPSDKYIDLTLGASGLTYTAPANGYYVLDKKTTSNISQIWISNNVWIDGRSGAQSASFIQFVTPPCQKGDIITVWYVDIEPTSGSFRFIYAEGSKE